MVCSKRPGIDENTNSEMMTIRYTTSEQYDGLSFTVGSGGEGCQVTRRGCDSLRGRIVSNDRLTVNGSAHCDVHDIRKSISQSWSISSMVNGRASDMNNVRTTSSHCYKLRVR